MIKKVINDVLPKGKSLLLKEESCRFCYEYTDIAYIKGAVVWI